MDKLKQTKNLFKKLMKQKQSKKMKNVCFMQQIELVELF